MAARRVPPPGAWPAERTPYDPALVPRARLPAEVVVAALVAVGVVVWGTLLRASDPTALGVATPPFVMSFGRAIAPGGLAVAVVVGLLAVPAAEALVRRALPGAVVALGGSTLALCLGLAVNLSREGTRGWWAIFDTSATGSFEAKNEYLPGLGAFRYGTGFFLDRFAELTPSLPVNVAGHPPLLMLVLHWTGITTAGGMAALCIGCFATLPAGTWALARALELEPQRARLAVALCALSPVALLFGVTSADVVMAAAGTGAAALLCARRLPLRLLGTLAFLACTLLSWALLAVGAFAAVAVLRRDGWRRALALAVGCGVAFLGGQGIIAAATGYDPIGALREVEAYYRNSVASVRPYWFWVIGSPVAFGLMLGPAIAGGAIAAVRRLGPAALGLAVVVVVASAAGFTKAETERIWLPFVPLACVAAAAVLPPGRIRLVAASLVLQAVLLGWLTYTVW